MLTTNGTVYTLFVIGMAETGVASTAAGKGLGFCSAAS